MSAAIIGYAHVSTDDQNLDLQRDALTRPGRTRLSLWGLDQQAQAALVAHGATKAMTAATAAAPTRFRQRAPATVLKTPVSQTPIVVHKATAAIEMMLAMNAYSITVTPATSILSRQKWAMRPRIRPSWRVV
jgi:hypothetical protein